MTDSRKGNVCHQPYHNMERQASPPRRIDLDDRLEAYPTEPTIEDCPSSIDNIDVWPGLFE